MFYTPRFVKRVFIKIYIKNKNSKKLIKSTSIIIMRRKNLNDDT